MIDFSYLSQFLIPCMLIASLIGGVAGWNMRRCFVNVTTQIVSNSTESGFSKKK